jgi:hypothetical protein
MNAPVLKWVAVVVFAAGLGAGAVFAFGPDAGAVPPDTTPVSAAAGADNPAPTKDRPKGEWIPKIRLIDGVLEDMPKSVAWVDAPPSAFPELKLPEREADDPFGTKYDAAVTKLCPRVLGKTPLTIEPTDDTPQKLLKARLQRGIIQWVRHREILRCELLNWGAAPEIVEDLADMEAICLELWGGQPKELVPWLEELVIEAKEFESFQLARALSNNAPPYRLDLAVRNRLRAETTLWKVKNKK